MHCNSENSYNTLFSGLQQMKDTYVSQNLELNFYTHELAHEKCKRIIAKGLPLVDTEYIKRELSEKGFKCESVIVLAKKDLPRNTMPVYLITFDKNTNLKDVRAIKYVYNVKETWERYKNRNKTTQCHRCQLFGHESSKCFSTPRCLHCGRKHLTKECPNKENNPICANCKKDHRANSKDCEIYNKRVSIITS